jgi:hypothetical protein
MEHEDLLHVSCNDNAVSNPYSNLNKSDKSAK